MTNAQLLDRLHETSRRLGLEVEALKTCLRNVREERDAARVHAVLQSDRAADLEARLRAAQKLVSRLQAELEVPRG